MSEVTVRQLADLVGTPVDRLLEQLAEAGMVFEGPDQTVTSTEKVKLLGFLRRAHGKTGAAPDLSEPKQITLKRRKVQELTVSTGARGKPKQTVAVEVRQKRTYVKRSSVEGSVDAEREEAIRLLEESRQLQAQEAEQSLQADARRAEEQAHERADEEARSNARENEQAQRDATEAALLAVVAPADAPLPSAADLPEPPPGDTPVRPRREINKPKPSGAAKDRARGPSGRRNELHLSDDLSKRRSSRRKPRRAIDTSRLSGGQHGFSRPTAPIIREVPIGESIIVSELAQKLAVKGSDVVKALFKMGVMTTINQPLDHDTAVLVVEELGHTAVAATDRGVENELVEKLDFAADGKTRPPIVTVMGHVDHGKTSLLDKIRAAKVATGEAGGITQHIGAYHVETPGGVVTFLDTPGHSAFSSMRARGAKLTDIVVLVVAADDGVKPQTIEALQHAKAAGVPMIVAVNKMDLPDANPENVKQGLSQHGIVPEDWGGETQFVPLSAKTGDGIDSLLEAILLQAEVLELTAPDEGRAAGVVVEASLDRGRGPVATVLVQRGQLQQGDFVVCGTEYGRVRALFDEAGQPVKTAGPSIPVQMLGLSGVPAAGDDLVVVDDERLAKDVAQDREAKRRESRLIKRGANRLEDLMAQMGQSEAQQQLNLVIKADVHGSAEALRESLEELSNDRIVIRAISTGVGGITESDATLAATSKALVIGFNVRADAAARRIIEADGLDLRYFSIIYDVIDQVRQVAEGILGTEIREDIIGTADVRDVFHSSKFGSVAGCIVVEGSVRRSNPIRVVRDQKVIFTGELESLRRFKEDVQEVKEGTECGIAVRQYDDVKAGDQIECYERIEVQRTLQSTVKPPLATQAPAEATPEG